MDLRLNRDFDSTSDGKETHSREFLPWQRQLRRDGEMWFSIFPLYGVNKDCHPGTTARLDGAHVEEYLQTSLLDCFFQQES